MGVDGTALGQRHTSRLESPAPPRGAFHIDLLMLALDEAQGGPHCGVPGPPLTSLDAAVGGSSLFRKLVILITPPVGSAART